MGGAVKSVGGFLGTSSGPQANVSTANSGLNQMNQNNTLAYGDTGAFQNLMGSAAAGHGPTQDQLSGFNQGTGLTQAEQGALASGAMTGTGVAQDSLNNNSAYNQTMNQGEQGFNQANSLYGNSMGQVQGAEDQLSKLQNQGFNLTPEDQSLYGQESGNIARQFGQAGNDTANNMASRGLSSSGAAGAAFSGLQGSQNEMLSQAQQQIAQTRFQNTMNQIGQQQQFINSMSGQAGNANQSGANINQNMGNYAGNQLQQQYGRQLSGAQNYSNTLMGNTGAQTQANASNNQANLQGQEFEQQNKPTNFMDYNLAGMGSSMYNTQAAPGKAVSSMAGSAGSMFGGA